ncbi:MAG: HD domain-containing protein [Ardenticatenaceae bacterium]|nr:HD domain-containing protein [Ardenticatenaceae bacterium]
MNQRNWPQVFEQYLSEQMNEDAAHDLSHIRRVVHNALALAEEEGADLAVVVPAAWLHDCVVVPKDSPLRSQASKMAAETAVTFLRTQSYPAQYLEGIAHAIAAHSFSAQILPETIEAKVVQDADRLDAIGAVGIARAFIIGGALGRPIYDEADPFCQQRQPDDFVATVDHFYTKLFKLVDTMQTTAGRREAARRTRFMRDFLAQLGREIDVIAS